MAVVRAAVKRLEVVGKDDGKVKAVVVAATTEAGEPRVNGLLFLVCACV